MVDIETVEQELGIELPEAYAWVADEFGIPTTEQYRFYTLDRLCWYRDHPRAGDAPLPGGGVVIGEDHVGHPVVFLSFPVAGVPVLSDEVYVIRPGQQPEEIAMDFATLVESLGIALVEQEHDLYETAFRVTGASDLSAAVQDVLTARGFLRAEHGDEEGTHVFVSVFEQTGTVWLRDIDASWLWFGRRLAARAKRVTNGWEVVVAPEPVQKGEDFEYPVSVRRVRIDARGEMRDVESGFQDTGANHGDPETTARNVLWDLVGAQDTEPDTLAFYQPPRPALTPRLAALLAAISESDAVDLTEVAGQKAIRIELPDGTRQLSVVKDEELALLREHTDAI